MKTPERIRVYGHDGEEKWLVRVSEDLYKISIPDNEELEKSTRFMYEKEEINDGKSIINYIAIDPVGGPYMTIGYRINPFYTIKNIIEKNNEVFIQIQKDVVEHAKLKFEKPEIEYDGDITRCYCKVSIAGLGSRIISGISKRRDPDTYDKYVGETVAISKMQQNAYKWFDKEITKKLYELEDYYNLLLNTSNITKLKLEHEQEYVKKF